MFLSLVCPVLHPSLTKFMEFLDSLLLCSAVSGLTTDPTAPGFVAEQGSLNLLDLRAGVQQAPVLPYLALPEGPASILPLTQLVLLSSPEHSSARAPSQHLKKRS
jgi:hypothetical protein